MDRGSEGWRGLWRAERHISGVDRGVSIGFPTAVGAGRWWVGFQKHSCHFGRRVVTGAAASDSLFSPTQPMFGRARPRRVWPNLAPLWLNPQFWASPPKCWPKPSFGGTQPGSRRIGPRLVAHSPIMAEVANTWSKPPSRWSCAAQTLIDEGRSRPYLGCVRPKLKQR